MRRARARALHRVRTDRLREPGGADAHALDAGDDHDVLGPTAEFTIGETGVDAPVSVTAAAGEQIVLTVTSSLLGHLAVTGDEKAGGFLEIGTTTLKFKVKNPGTYPLEFHWDDPEPFQIGEIVITP